MSFLAKVFARHFPALKTLSGIFGKSKSMSTVHEWAGSVIRPSGTFEPIRWGAGFHLDRPREGFGIVIVPPAFKAEASLRIWRQASTRFTVPGRPIAELRFDFGDLLGDRPAHLPTMIWFPLPALKRGLYLADVALLEDGQPRPFGVGYCPAQEWTWQTGFFTTADGIVRPVSPQFGMIWDLGNIPRSPPLVSEIGGMPIPRPSYSRYDLVSVDEDGTPHLLLGADRELDPEEFVPSPPAAHTPLHVLFSTPGGSEIIPVHEWRNGVKIGEEAVHAAWLDHCRARLPNLITKLRNGQDIVLAGYGDSITSLGQRSPEQVLKPNGPWRDILDYFDAYARDWKASVPLHNGRHHRFGWNWFLKAAMEDRWGVSVSYDNWGLAGTTSGTGVKTIDGFDYPNAANPERLQRMLDEKPDLVVVSVGMNDIGDPIDTRANVIAIGSAIRAAGSEMIIMAPPRQSPRFHSRDDLLWRYTHNKVIEAARELDVAFVALDRLYDETGAMGLSRQSHCAASYTNHPGARELAAIGRMLANIVPARSDF